MERIITALLIDDDSQARDILRKFLEIEETVQIVACLENTLHAVEVINKYKPDVVFLDINMPFENGLKFASRMKELNIETLLVFTTAFHNYALDAFNMKPFEFLVKPFGVTEISTLLKKIEKYFDDMMIASYTPLMTDYHGKLRFRTNHGYLFLLPKEIVFIRSARNYCEFFLTSGLVEKVLLPISIVSKEFEGTNFQVLNRSVIINLSYVTRIDRKLKKCVVSLNETEFELPITQKNLNFFENLDSLKLG